MELINGTYFENPYFFVAATVAPYRPLLRLVLYSQIFIKGETALSFSALAGI
jgi:hypothetical protein